MHDLIYVCEYSLPTYKAEGLQAIRMCEAFSRAGMDVTLLHYHYPEDDNDENALNAQSLMTYYQIREAFAIKPIDNASLRLVAKLKPLSSKSIRGLFILGVARSLLTALAVRRESGDLYYTRNLLTAWWLTRMKLPTVYEAMTFPSRRFVPVLRAMGSSSSLIMVVAITSYLARDIVDKASVPARKVRPLHVGVDSEQFEAPAGKGEARYPLGLRADGKFVVYTGGLREDRGIDILLDVARFLDSDAEFLIVGGRPTEVSELERCLKSKGTTNVRLYGHVSPARARLFQKAADILVLPQRRSSPHLTYYTSPAKLFEYMACGRPIVASNIPCIRDVLIDNENALLVEHEAQTEWIRAISLLLNDGDLRERLSKQAQSDARKYTWRSRAEQILNWIREDPFAFRR